MILTNRVEMIAPPHFNETAHQGLGLVIGISSIIQVILGFICDYLYDPEREQPPMHDVAHWWIGRITFGLALLNMPLGMINMTMEEYAINPAIPVFFAIFLIAGTSAFYYGRGYFEEERNNRSWFNNHESYQTHYSDSDQKISTISMIYGN